MGSRKLTWPELLQGGTNPSERADSGLVDYNDAGTPTDALGVAAGTNTDLGSYSFALTSLDIPSEGPPLDLSVSYDSELVSNTTDGSDSGFATGWRLSTEITGSQEPASSEGTACQIHIWQADGTELIFDPSSGPIADVCPTGGYEPLPWEQATLGVQLDCGDSSDACWVVTSDLTGMETYVDEITGKIILQKDRNSNEITYSYDDSGNLASISEGGRSIDFTYAAGASSSNCPGTFYTESIAKCIIATDPLGRSASSNGRCNGPVMMTGSTRTANRWRDHHGRYSTVRERARRDTRWH